MPLVQVERVGWEGLLVDPELVLLVREDDVDGFVEPELVDCLVQVSESVCEECATVLVLLP